MRELRGLGLTPDIIACRSKTPFDDSIRKKISMFCHVPENHVINVYDCTSLYRYGKGSGDCSSYSRALGVFGQSPMGARRHYPLKLMTDICPFDIKL